MKYLRKGRKQQEITRKTDKIFLFELMVSSSKDKQTVIVCVFRLQYISYHMLKNLRSYLMAQDQNDLTDLIQYNDSLKKRISELQQKLQKTEQIPSLSNYSTTDKLPLILMTLETPLQSINLQLKSLGQQRKYLATFCQYIEHYIDHEKQTNQPRSLQQKLKMLTDLTKLAIQQGYPREMTTKMKEWNQKLMGQIQKRLYSLVSVFSNKIRINLPEIQIYRDMLTENIYREFVKILYKDVINYDVPTFSYLLAVPYDTALDEGVIVAKREIVVFKCEKAQANYTKIEKAIAQTQKLVQQIAQSIGKEDKQIKQCMYKQINKSKQQLKSQIQYILPYLNVQKRKQILSLLTTKSQQETTLYDILVRLRIKGQDGDMMDANVALLVEKISQQAKKVSDGLLKNVMEEVFIFLQICQNEDKSLSIGFYISNQLINRLEGIIEYAYIQELINIREDIRFRIHHPS